MFRGTCKKESGFKFSWDNCLKSLEQIMARKDMFQLFCNYIHSLDCANPSYVIRGDRLKYKMHYLGGLTSQKMNLCYFVEANFQIKNIWDS